VPQKLSRELVGKISNVFAARSTTKELPIAMIENPKKEHQNPIR
jgi:hypothetical protein